MSDEARIAERAEMALKTNAEAYRLAQEAIEQRERAEKAEAERDHWRDLAVSHALERDSLRRTLEEIIGVHPARIVRIAP